MKGEVQLRRIPLPRTPVNKGIKRAGAATPRPSTTPFLALLHAEGFRHLRREVGVVVHYLPSVRFATVDVRHALSFDAYRLVSDSPLAMLGPLCSEEGGNIGDRGQAGCFIGPLPRSYGVGLLPRTSEN